MAYSKIVTETQRLLLRHFTLEDADDLAILYADPALIDPDNIASQKVAAKVGLTYEKDVILEDKPVRVYAIYALQ